MPHVHVLSYFTTEEESLHLAVSVDGRSFYAVDDGREVLRGTIGSRSIRDPFIAIGPDGRFHLLGTNGWESDAIVHTASDDLLTWDEQTLLPVMADVAGTLNCWAPEFFVEPGSGRARIIWSSVVDPHPVDGPQADQDWNRRHQAIWSCLTTDFAELSPAEVYFDPGFSVIDASVLVQGDEVLMAYKDERGDPVVGGEHNRIHVRRTTPSASNELGAVTPSPTEGPTLYRHDDELVMLFDHYLEGRYGAVASTDGHSWTPAAVQVPNGVRHAAVMTLPSEHAAVAALLARTAIGGR
ncbi:hypothetical protein [Microbacterium sp. ZW T5_56]|uniref:hypothetical protein n=1 Tax=Microbacterium sp. ZW T5_56 TaxID=3378081 RepID=UPI00385419C2